MEEKYIRKVTRTGKRSLSIVIPSEIVDKMKIKEKQKLVVKKIKGGFVVRDYRSKK